jgi:hypothetical protein
MTRILSRIWGTHAAVLGAAAGTGPAVDSPTPQGKPRPDIARTLAGLRWMVCRLCQELGR